MSKRTTEIAQYPKEMWAVCYLINHTNTERVDWEYDEESFRLKCSTHMQGSFRFGDQIVYGYIDRITCHLRLGFIDYSLTLVAGGGRGTEASDMDLTLSGMKIGSYEKWHSSIQQGNGWTSISYLIYSDADEVDSMADQAYLESIMVDGASPAEF